VACTWSEILSKVSGRIVSSPSIEGSLIVTSVSRSSGVSIDICAASTSDDIASRVSCIVSGFPVTSELRASLLAAAMRTSRLCKCLIISFCAEEDNLLNTEFGINAS
jgi:hypothetical protein